MSTSFRKFFAQIYNRRGENLLRIIISNHRYMATQIQKRLFELTEQDLGKVVGIDIGFSQIEKGKLTDFYGSFDEDNNAIIAVEIDENLTYFMPPNGLIYL